MVLAYLTLIPFLGAVLTKLSTRLGRYSSAWVAILSATLALCLLWAPAQQVWQGSSVVQQVALWVPAMDVNLAFRLDGLSLLFTLMILLIGLIVVIYARYYLSPRDSMGRFYAYLLLFMGSMLGVVLSENIIQLLMFWELTSLSSFLLISYWQQREEASRGARMALTITGGGGLAMLGGFLLLGNMAGSYELSDILLAGDTIRSHAHYPYMLVLILLGVFTKSAQFPFHFWLPNAMAAPTPVSAYLHSATMVKAGIFLLARLFPALSGTQEWTLIVSSVGIITFIMGSYFALSKHDMKALLAYSTISHLGLIVALFGIGSPLAVVAGIFHIINHATFKASLFMMAGIVDHETGTRDMRQLRGLRRYMPHSAVLMVIAAAAMAGIPGLNGFISKEMFLAEVVQHGHASSHPWLLPVIVTAGAIFSAAYSLRIAHNVFFGAEPKDLPKSPHEPSRGMQVPVEILVIACIVIGLFPQLAQPLVTLVADSTLQHAAPEFHLAIWHGLTPELLMSAVALLGGIIVYTKREIFFSLQTHLDGKLDAKMIYNGLMRRLFALSSVITMNADNLSQKRMLWILFVTSIALGAYGFFSGGSPLAGDRPMLPVDPMSAMVAIIMMVAAVSTVIMHQQRFTSLVLVSAVGLGVALTFVKFSAPDLALTQLAVEFITAVLLLLALFFLPQTTPDEQDRLRQGRDVAIALVAGIGIAALSYAVLTRDYTSIADYFIANSISGGGGANVVNVLLVDFRGFDTMGEITVLALAGLGIYAMLDQLKLLSPKQDAEGRPWNPDTHPLVLATFSRILLPLALLVAVFILLRGHNQPGGGFIAGLITSAALIVQYLANGVEWTRSKLPANTHPLIGYGLLVAASTGIASWYFGYPFLTSTFNHLHLPVLGEFELASAMAFDIGVFLVVVGTSLLILINLGMIHQVSYLPRIHKPASGKDAKTSRSQRGSNTLPIPSDTIKQKKGMPWKH
ncbi:multisubunit potassium/proton antiporter, PhaA subunit /multisubunit potassium/proton antiporter, PhaB subunit [Methylobacillus rhizosphaerae]|uniref:Multisubunit potassium/proton antiporter, PhaA subunit /multisubunit potassium/proton antiporter, PhaB subunit n=1 Tax=Methylobacillus rhizosphaerae TaxID=551994 RepID=A0A239B465_9PROT|nr:monovalent cation/H+ antiporter subunit A [Methylobacillus rhizosphaerae]SNS02312.1 multisubunit potassium/proton antiporter, PhaA subunit /multisubunit potassium/proton antiporter, PhaB subunit [Methylobacillus rhizosphaerae]